MTLKTPAPYKKPAGNWPKEDFDALLPTPGFITDFTYALRGMEAPTIFAFWAAVHTMSVMLKRHVWFPWFFGKRFANFYIMLVAPPRQCGKSEVVKFSERVLKIFPKFIENPGWKFLKTPNFIRTRATPESLADALVPSEFKYAEGSKVQTVKIGSELAIVASEGSTFLGKQQYNLGLIDRLTHYFDCMDDDSDRTRKGVQEFRDMYVTAIIATTPKGVESSIPPEAFEGGFLSRLVMIYQEKSLKENAYPIELPDAAGPEELGKRLAWLSTVAKGEYHFDDEADAEYRSWYHHFKTKMLGKDEDSERKQTMMQRYDVHLMKLALILRAQQYRPGNEIGIHEFDQARKILDYTYGVNHIPTDSIGDSSVDKHHRRVRELIQKSGAIDRQSLARKMSPYKCYVEELNQILNHLSSEAQIEIVLNGKRENLASRSTKEVYKWVAIIV